MVGDISLLGQLVNSLSEAVGKLEQAKINNQVSEFNKIRDFILQIQGKIKEELAK